MKEVGNVSLLHVPKEFLFNEPFPRPLGILLYGSLTVFSHSSSSITEYSHITFVILTPSFGLIDTLYFVPHEQAQNNGGYSIIFHYLASL